MGGGCTKKKKKKAKQQATVYDDDYESPAQIAASAKKAKGKSRDDMKVDDLFHVAAHNAILHRQRQQGRAVRETSRSERFDECFSALSSLAFLALLLFYVTIGVLHAVEFKRMLEASSTEKAACGSQRKMLQWMLLTQAVLLILFGCACIVLLTVGFCRKAQGKLFKLDVRLVLRQHYIVVALWNVAVCCTSLIIIFTGDAADCAASRVDEWASNANWMLFIVTIVYLIVIGLIVLLSADPREERQRIDDASHVRQKSSAAATQQVELDDLARQLRMQAPVQLPPPQVVWDAQQ
jgi:heme/copper-type cytochrome/quinol oxidase subunit 2